MDTKKLKEILGVDAIRKGGMGQRKKGSCTVGMGKWGVGGKFSQNKALKKISMETYDHQMKKNIY